MAYGFVTRDAVGTTRFSDGDIGFQVVHEETLTAQQTSVTFDLDVDYISDYIELQYMWVSQTAAPQNVYSITDDTDWANYNGTVTLTVTIAKTSTDSYNCRFYVYAGDLATLSVQGVTV